jgi:signal transduction histidine kinase
VLGAAAVVAVLAGALAASSVAAGLVRPLERLAASARRLGEGDFSERAPRAGLPEPDGIADALDVTADRLGRAVTRSRAFAADASHQLRTPVTALRLQLESAAVGLAPDSEERDAVEAALTEVDRLVGTIDELVALTQLDTVAEEVDVAALVASRFDVWERRATARGRVLAVVTADVPAARVRPAAILQATDVLVDNALRHGRGRVEVHVLPPAGDGTEVALRVVVEDEGPGLPEDLDALGDRVDRGAVPVHGGRGLLLARDLVEGEGGRLVLSSSTQGTRASILVPVTVARGAHGSERAD